MIPKLGILKFLRGNLLAETEEEKLQRVAMLDGFVSQLEMAESLMVNSPKTPEKVKKSFQDFLTSLKDWRDS